jgi:hypothetical protein
MVAYHENQLRVVTAQTLVSHKCDVLAVCHQTVLLDKGKIILSCLKIEYYGADFNNKPLLLPGGNKRILMDVLSLIMTPDVDWDPTKYDDISSDIHTFYYAEDNMKHRSTIDNCGNYCHLTAAIHSIHPEPGYLQRS